MACFKMSDEVTNSKLEIQRLEARELELVGKKRNNLLSGEEADELLLIPDKLTRLSMRLSHTFAILLANEGKNSLMA